MARFSHLLTDTITVQEPAGRAGANRTFGAKFKLKVRFEDGRSFDVGVDRNERSGNGVVGSDREIALDSRIWPPGADETDDDQSRRANRKRNAAFPGTTERLYETELA